MKDKIVQNVIDKYQQRSQIGIKKYGTTLEDNNIDNFLLHAQEKAQDLTLYLEKEIQKRKKGATIDMNIYNSLNKKEKINFLNRITEWAAEEDAKICNN